MWGRYFTWSVMHRGREYADDGHVDLLTPVDLEHTLSASVHGGRKKPYRVAIDFAPTQSGSLKISCDCDCPYGDNCKHAAATLYAALRLTKNDDDLDDEPVVKRFLPARVAARKSAQVQPKPLDPIVTAWLARATIVDREGESPEPKQGDERVVYIFGAGAPVTFRRPFPLDAIVERWLMAGRWSKVRDCSVESLVAQRTLAVTSEDAVIGNLIKAMETVRPFGPAHDDLLRRIVGTGRAYWREPQARALRIGPPIPASAAWRLDDDGNQSLELEFDEPGVERMRGIAPWYVDVAKATIGPFDAGMSATSLSQLLDAPRLSVETARRVRDELQRSTGTSHAPLPLDVIEVEVDEPPVPIVTLLTLENQHRAYRDPYSYEAPDGKLDLAAFSFSYGGARVAAHDPVTTLRRADGDRVLVYKRSLRAETDLAVQLYEMGFDRDPFSTTHRQVPGLALRLSHRLQTSWPAITHRLLGMRAEGWQIEVEDGFRHRVIEIDADGWHPEVESSGNGWFDLALDIDIDGKRIPLLPLLRDLAGLGIDLTQDGRTLTKSDVLYVKVPGHGTIAFPAERLRAIMKTLVELDDPEALSEDGRLRFAAVRANVVNELELGSGLKWALPKRMRELGDRLATIDKLPRAKQPPSFVGKLREYQREGLDWLQFLGGFGLGGILADDMGLGKSVQTLAHLLTEKEAGRLKSPALLVVPTSLVFNWVDEAQRFAPSLNVLSLHGADRATRFDRIATNDLVITTYPLLPRDAVLTEREWHAVIFDEAQTIKNPAAKATQVAAKLRAGHRVCLTGTPVENHLGDLWTLLSVALPGALGDRKTFTKLFRTPIEKHGDVQRGRILAERVRPFVLRRTKDEVVRELPPKTEIVRRIELSPEQRDLYETVRVKAHERVRDEIAKHGLAQSQIVILDALLKLRQVCCDPRLLPTTAHKTAPSAKLDFLREMLPQMIEEGRRVLLYSQFTSMLALIEPMLAELEIPYVQLTGQTKDRATPVKAFQDGDVPLFLISLKAGGVGLNLTAADTVVHYDPWWNPAVENQASARAHRIGQQRQVFIYKLIGAGTVEEKIVDMQQRKAKLAEAIFSEKAGADTRFTAADIERLFAPLG